MRTTTLAFAALIACSSHLPQALAQTQSACSSDGQPQPLALVERFISADCEACWSDPAHPTPSAQANVVTLDWIAPGTLGDDAPRSAAATRDALQRLDTLARAVPPRTDAHIATVQQAPAHSDAYLRVGHGPPVNDYLGATIAFQPARGMAARGPWTYYLLLETKTKATHIPYRGGSPHVTAILSNEVQFIKDNLVNFLPHIQAGKLRALAVVAHERLAQLPDVPTFAELGYPQLNMTSWTGIAAPAGTPAPIVAKLHQAIRKAATDPAMVEQLTARGVIPPEEMTPAQFEKMMSDRLVSYGDVVRRAKVKPE